MVLRKWLSSLMNPRLQARPARRGKLNQPKRSAHQTAIVTTELLESRQLLSAVIAGIDQDHGTDSTDEVTNDGTLDFYVNGTVSATESFRDYTNLEWWRAPSSTLAQHITGPYVDYLCTDDYTLTLTAPVLFTSRMVGVVGADLYVNDIERALLPRVASIDGSATIVNASGRVVVSNDTARPTGSLLRLDTLSGTPGGPVVLSDGRTVIPCQKTSLLLVLDAP